MKTKRIQFWAISALGLWLLSAQAGHCFYNPSTGRWINRDPVGEKGFIKGNSWRLGLVQHTRLPSAPVLDGTSIAGNDTPNRFDVLGLAYTEVERKAVCDEFVKEYADDKRAMDMGGTAVCKNGIAYPCYFAHDADNWAPEIKSCLLDHEKSHCEDAQKNGACKRDRCSLHASPELAKLGASCKRCTLYYVTYKDAEVARKSECKAYLVLWKCIKKYAKPDPMTVGYMGALDKINRYLQDKNGNYYDPPRCPEEFPDNMKP